MTKEEKVAALAALQKEIVGWTPAYSYYRSLADPHNHMGLCAFMAELKPFVRREKKHVVVPMSIIKDYAINRGNAHDDRTEWHEKMIEQAKVDRRALARLYAAGHIIPNHPVLARYIIKRRKRLEAHLITSRHLVHYGWSRKWGIAHQGAANRSKRS